MLALAGVNVGVAIKVLWIETIVFDTGVGLAWDRCGMKVVRTLEQRTGARVLPLVLALNGCAGDRRGALGRADHDRAIVDQEPRGGARPRQSIRRVECIDRRNCRGRTRDARRDDGDARRNVGGALGHRDRRDDGIPRAS